MVSMLNTSRNALSRPALSRGSHQAWNLSTIHPATPTGLSCIA